MRILAIIIDQPTMGPTWRQIRSLESAGAQMEILAIKGPPKLKYLRAFLKQRKLLRAVDMIHAHYGFSGWVARGQVGKPVVVSFMGSDLLLSEAFTGWPRQFCKLEIRANHRLAQLVDAVIVKSRPMAESLAPVKAHVIPNGIELRDFKPMRRCDARAALGWEQDARYVLFPGNPKDPNKGFALARATVEEAAREARAPLQLVPLWKVQPDTVPLYMNACDAMLMTSFAEGSPNVVKEAMACNLPVISMPVGDVPELLDGVRGCRVCARNAQLMARELIRTLDSRETVDGRAALIRMGLDLESVARRILGVYEGVLRGTPPDVGAARVRQPVA